MSECIEILNRWGEGFSAFAWPMLWQSSLLIAAIFAFDLMFARRIRPSVRYTLWMVVLVKLILPPALALPTGATWWLWRPHQLAETPAIQNYTVSFGNSVREALPAATVPISVLPPKITGDAWALLAVFAMGAGLLSWLAFRWMRVAAKVRRAATPPSELDGILEEARQLAGLRRPLRLKLIDDRQSPAVYGLFRPVILLPRTLANQLAGRQLRAVLLHEAIHIRRVDVWVNFAQTLLQIAYWWHPLLWVANARIRRVREEAVDDAVMFALRDGADAYAPTLLEVAKFAFRRPLASLGLIGILESRSALRQRVERLVDFQPSRRAGLTLLSLFGIFAFSAVALPMGQGPATAPVAVSTDGLRTEVFQINPNTYFLNLQKKVNVPAVAGKPSARGGMLVVFGQLPDVVAPLKQVLSAQGVNLDSPKSMVYNAGKETLSVHATAHDLAIIEKELQVLNDGRPIIHTSAVRDSIYRKLNSIHLDEVSFSSLPLNEVLRELRQQSLKRDPDKQGINFLFNPNNPLVPVAIDPNTGLPRHADATPKPADPTQININLNLKNVSLQEALDAICSGADQPIKYSVEDYGIVFSVKDTNSVQYEIGTFRVDPRAFLSKLKASVGYSGPSKGAHGIATMAKKYFSTLGVTIDPPKAVFYNERMGELYVYATSQNLDVIKKAIQDLGVSPPMVHIKARFIEVPQKFFSSAVTKSMFPGLTNGSILTKPEFQVFLHKVESQEGSEEMGEPEATTLTGRQTQMRAMITQSIVTNFTVDGSTYVPQTAQVETGPVFDVVPDLLSDGYTIRLHGDAVQIDFLGYDSPGGLVPNVAANAASTGVLPVFQTIEASYDKLLPDQQTLVLFPASGPSSVYVSDEKAKERISKAVEQANERKGDKIEIVLCTATLIDPAGNRVHSDSDYYDLQPLPASP